MSIGRLPGLLPDNPDRTRRDMILKTDKEEKTFVLSGILVFADKIIDTETAKYIKEVVRMTQVAELLLEEGREEGRLQGIQALIDSLKSLLIPDETIIEQLIERYQMSQDEASEFLEGKKHKI